MQRLNFKFCSFLFAAAIAQFLFSSDVKAQGEFGMPLELAQHDSLAFRRPNIKEISRNYHDLMINPDTSLNRARKRASRWMAHTMPYLGPDEFGYLTKDYLTDAMKSIYNSPLNCNGSDLAEWSPDGPTHIPDWIDGEDAETPGNRPQQMAGQVRAIYNNPTNLQEIIAGTLTSGIMRSTDGGTSWNCVTDELAFPVLGVRQFLGDPDDADRVLAITGTSSVEGGLIISDNGGEDWYQGQVGLPEFRWLSYHPTIDDLIFACSASEIYFSSDNGDTWVPVVNPIPSDFPPPASHPYFYKILALEDRLIALSDFSFASGAEVFECTYDIIEPVFNLTANWVNNSSVLDGQLVSEGMPLFVDISNLAMGRFYVMAKYDSDDVVIESTDGGETYSEREGEFASRSQVGLSELIASKSNSDVYYQGAAPYMRRFNDVTGFETDISPAPGAANGHHDDYRSSHIINIDGADRIVFGNDGGVGLVNDGLDPSPVISTLNGDLNINLLHGFNIHEETGRTAFAFQDHAMVYRDHNSVYSNPFLFEGGFAMVHQHYPSAIIGAHGNSIQDRNPSTYPIVQGSISQFSYSGYQRHYRHFPDRFAAGLIGGKIGLNRGKNVKEIVDVSIFQDQGSDNDDYEVGDVAICQRKPQFIYAASASETNAGNQNCLVKSINDVDLLDTPWINISDNLVSGLDINENPETRTLKSIMNYRYIRALGVDPFDENLVYCGVGSVFNEWSNTLGENEIKDEKYRVLLSTTGGEPNENNTNDAAWIDWSEGLPAFPVERLLTVESDNHLIFAATSVGIYYRTDGMPAWQCFSEGLPKVEITGLQYDYCNNMLYASTYGRGLWKTPVNIPIPNSFSVVVDQNETWDENKTIHTDITITNGAELVITAIIRMATGTNIIIEPGAKLHLDGGTLTNACGEMWQGITVLGNTFLAQNPVNSGTLITSNDATIEYAREAIRMWDWINQDWGTLGGIIKCSNTNFINNKRSCEFMAYNQIGGHSLNYRGHFNNCHFEFNNDNLLTATETAPLAPITLWGVKGVAIRGCTFLNTSDVAQSEDRENGIASIDASFIVDGLCSVPIQVGGTCPLANLDKTIISGYRNGIKATGAFSTASPFIRNTAFDKNMVGIKLEAASFSKVIDNEFIVGDHPYPTPQPLDDDATYNTGVLTSGLTGFIIEENKFYGDDTNTEFTHGIAVQSGGGSSETVYRNEMTNLGSGAIGAGDNDDVDGAYGLRFLCNENIGNSTDFEVRGIEGLSPNGYIDESLNGFDHPSQEAGNTFSMEDGLIDNFVHFDFDSDKEYTYQYSDVIANRKPLYQETNIDPDPPGDIYHDLTTIANTCPTNYPTSGGPDKYVLKGEFLNEKSAYYNLLYTYHQFIDQGNTEAALNDVVLSWSNDAWTLHNELMARSPYNSDTVLIAAANRNILPHGMLLEVLVSNPDALRNGKVISHVACCIADPIPQYMIDILLASRNVQTARTLTERNLSNLRQKMALNHRMVINDMLRDSTGTHPDTLTNWLDEMRHKEGRYTLISEYLSRKDFTNAREAMDSLQSQLKLGSAGTKELNKMRQFTSFLENINGQGKNIAQLDSTQIDWLVNIANDPESGTAGARAKNILCFFYRICSPPPSVPKSNKISPRKPKPSVEELIKAQNKVSFAPNPADQYIQLEYELLYSKENTEMRVYDQLGRVVKTYTIGVNNRGVEILDTRKMVAGLYIVEIVQEGKQVFSDKFIVQH